MIGMARYGPAGDKGACRIGRIAGNMVIRYNVDGQAAASPCPF